MKLITAVYRHERLPDVQAALDMRLASMISIGRVSDNASPGESQGYIAVSQGSESLLRFEIAVMDQYVEGAVEAIYRHGYTAESVQAGDVKIIVTCVTACFLTVQADDGVRSVSERPESS
jgi:nitrogen regulatory protein PII